MKLLIATTNPGKLAEIQRFLSDLKVELVGLKDVGIVDAVEETGATFEENAILKAKHYSQESGLPTIADDGGFEIDGLGGAPGVKSHRWIDGARDNDDEDLIQYTMEKMKHLPEGKRGAQLRLVLALVLPTGAVHTAEAAIRGVVPLAPSDKRHGGFPFRSLLFLPEIHKFYNHDELTEEESMSHNHRRKALESLKPFIRGLLTNHKKSVE